MAEAAAAAAAAVAPMECRLKAKCPSKTEPGLHNCWNPDCFGWMHKKCSDLLLQRHDVPLNERPKEEDVTVNDEPIVFCKKGCYTKWLNGKKKVAKAAIAKAKATKDAEKEASKKKRTPWEEDGSLQILLEWITTEGNCAECCGANGNKGKSKAQFHKELSIKLKDNGCERSDKDVENEINNLERQFRVASDWANNTGQGVDNPGDFEEATAKRCPLHKELEPIMGDRPNAKPLATNEDSDTDMDAVDAAGGDMEEDEDEDSGVADMAAVHSMNNPTEEETPPKKTASSVSSSGNSSKSSGNRKRLVTTKKDDNKKKRNTQGNTDKLISTFLGVEDGAFESFRSREVAAREQEATARMMEAKANSAKANAETRILSVQAKATLLRERKRPLEEGISQEEMDASLPIESDKKW